MLPVLHAGKPSSPVETNGSRSDIFRVEADELMWQESSTSLW
jgi:hypothetical protein